MCSTALQTKHQETATGAQQRYSDRSPRAQTIARHAVTQGVEKLHWLPVVQRQWRCRTFLQVRSTSTPLQLRRLTRDREHVHNLYDPPPRRCLNHRQGRSRSALSAAQRLLSGTRCRRQSCIATLIPFLANVNSPSRSLYTIARPSSVCLSSVTFMRPTQAVQVFGNISTALGTLAISGHPLKNLRRCPRRTPRRGS